MTNVLPNKGPYRLVWTINGKSEQFRYATEAQAKSKAQWMRRNGAEVKLFKAVGK